MNNKTKQFEKLEKQYEYLEYPILARICDKISEFGCWLSRCATDVEEKVMERASVKQDRLEKKIMAHPSYNEFYGAE